MKSAERAAGYLRPRAGISALPVGDSIVGARVAREAAVLVAAADAGVDARHESVAHLGVRAVPRRRKVVAQPRWAARGVAAEQPGGRCAGTVLHSARPARQPLDGVPAVAAEDARLRRVPVERAAGARVARRREGSAVPCRRPCAARRAGSPRARTNAAAWSRWRPECGRPRATRWGPWRAARLARPRRPARRAAT